MKQKFLLFLLFMGVVALNTTNAQTYMHVYNTGATGNYDTDDVSVMTFTTTDLEVNDLGTVVPYAMNDVSKITFDASPLNIVEPITSTVGIYPNPTDGVVTLNISNETATEFVVNIYNVTGAIVKTTTYPSNDGMLNERIDLSSYVKGIYMLRINSGNNVITKKIIKK